MRDPHKVQFIDSHTAGEPTRIVVSGGPDLGQGSLVERLKGLRSNHDRFRSAVVNEPRGSDVLVGGIMVEPEDRDSAAAVIFFNNVGYLGMCGHGMMGLIKTLSYLGRISCGEHRIETPAGAVRACLHPSGEVSVQNVVSYRYLKSIEVPVPGYGKLQGDVAWGGNWFFLVAEHGQDLSLRNVKDLTEFTWEIRQALPREGINGRDGQEIDHIELFGPAENPENHSRNFVLCPGKAYDRSPCGTGTSAKVACLFADGKLREGEIWRQESIIGSVFEASVQEVQGGVVPSIKGQASITGEGNLILDESDPFCWGIRG